ncbi:MAG: T9SS type A sorting domain-containing protein, partial [Bacteroidota bacterium]
KSLSLDFEWCNGLSIKHNSAYFGAKDSIGLALHRYDLEGNSLARSTHYGRPMAWSNNVHLMVYEFDTLFLMDQDLQKINHHLLKDYSPYGGSVLGNHFWDFIPLNGWGVVLGGYTGSAVSSLHGPFLMRLDHHGEEVFGYNYSVPDMPISSIMVVEEVHDGYVIVIENLYTYDESWLIRLDKNGLLSTQEPPANKPALRVFPNPSTDAIQVQFPYVGDWRLVLVHSLGQELQTQTLLNTAIYLLDTSTFAAGTYILLARDQKGGLFSQKIQINRD